jgi:hypothetical protein
MMGSSKFAAVRLAAKTLAGVFKNIQRDFEHVNKAEEMYGAIEGRSMLDAVQLSNMLKSMLEGESPDAMRRIDEVLDPIFYSRNKTKQQFFDELDNFYLLSTGQTISGSFTPAEMQDLYDTYLDQGDARFDNVITKESDLTSAELAVYEMIRQAYDFLHDVNFVMGNIEYETYILNKGNYHARMYNIYEMPSDISQETQQIQKYMQLGMYKKRGALNEWKLQEKIEDPIHAVTKRLYQTKLNLAIHNYTRWVVTKRPNLVSKTKQPGMVLMKGRGYGAFNGKYVTKDLAEDFKGFHFSNEMMQTIYQFPKYIGDQMYKFQLLKPLTTRWWKKVFTVFQPATHIGNYTGNAVFASWIGVSPLRFNTNYWTTARQEIKNKGDLYLYMMSKGMIGTDIAYAELTSNLNQVKEILGEGLPTAEEWKKNPIEAFDNMAQHIYHSTDNISKVAAMQSLLQLGYNIDVAAEKVKAGFQNKYRVGGLYKVFSAIPLIGPPFGQFAGDLVRIIRSGVTKTPLTVGVYVSAMHALAGLAQYWDGEDDKRRKLREERPGAPSIPLPAWAIDNLGLPDWFKYIPVINFFTGNVPLSYKIFDDQELNLARFLSPMYIYNSLTSDEIDDAFRKLSPLPIEAMPKTGDSYRDFAVWSAKMVKQPFIGPIVQLFIDSDFRGQHIIDRDQTTFRQSTMTKSERQAAAAEFLLRNNVPYGALMNDIYRINQSGQDYYGRTKTTNQAILRYFGYNAQMFDESRYKQVSQKAINAKVSQFKRSLDMLNQLVGDYKKTQEYDNLLDYVNNTRTFILGINKLQKEGKITIMQQRALYQSYIRKAPAGKTGLQKISDEVFLTRLVNILDEQAKITQEAKVEIKKSRGVLKNEEIKSIIINSELDKFNKIKMLQFLN